MLKNYIFVDIDGVLNHPGCWGKRPEQKAIDPALVARLKTLVEETGAKCVLSSAWRHAYGYEKTLFALSRNGWPDIADYFVGETPVDHARTRAHEILQWLAENGTPGYQAFVVLDDCTHAEDGAAEFKMVADQWVQVNGALGLQDHDVERAKVLFARQALAALVDEAQATGTYDT